MKKYLGVVLCTTLLACSHDTLTSPSPTVGENVPAPPQSLVTTTPPTNLTPAPPSGGDSYSVTVTEGGITWTNTGSTTLNVNGCFYTFKDFHNQTLVRGGKTLPLKPGASVEFPAPERKCGLSLQADPARVACAANPFDSGFSSEVVKGMVFPARECPPDPEPSPTPRPSPSPEASPSPIPSPTPEPTPPPCTPQFTTRTEVVAGPWSNAQEACGDRTVDTYIYTTNSCTREEVLTSHLTSQESLACAPETCLCEPADILGCEVKHDGRPTDKVEWCHVASATNRREGLHNVEQCLPLDKDGTVHGHDTATPTHAADYRCVIPSVN